MQAEGIVSKVDVSTPWRAGIVAVPKKSGTVCIRIDLKRLNQSVMRDKFTA